MTDTQLAKTTDATQAKADSGDGFVKPHYLITTGEKAYTVDVMLPGVSKDGIEAVIDGGFLTVTGIRPNDIPEEWKTINREIDQTNYRLRLKVNARVDSDAMTARAEDGVLSVKLPRKAKESARKIKIS